MLKSLINLLRIAGEWTFTYFSPLLCVDASVIDVDIGNGLREKS